MNTNFFHDSKISRIIEQALCEDIGFGDITSESIIPEQQFGKGYFLAKENGIISGIELLQIIFHSIDSQITITPKVHDGSFISAKTSIAEIDGPVRGILLGERVALNFLQRMSGIATLTHTYIHAIAGTNAKITDTRKTVPGLRMVDRKAVRDGGGINHRFGLDQMILIKDNHIAAAGNIKNAIQKSLNYCRAHNIDIKIEVETTSIGQVEQVLECSGVHRIMLDNFSLDEMKKAVEIIHKKLEIEASGGISLHTVRPIAETGVDYISIGALTHSPKALDISLELLHSDKKDW